MTLQAAHCYEHGRSTLVLCCTNWSSAPTGHCQSPALPIGQANALAWHWHTPARSTNWSSTQRSVRPTSAFLRRACAEHADVRQTSSKSGVFATSTNYKKAKQWHSHFCWRCAATIGRQCKLLRPTRLSEKHGPALPAILPTCNLSSRRYHRPSISTHASHPAMHVCAPQ